jgi:large subunit ribosomal protein L7/L12
MSTRNWTPEVAAVGDRIAALTLAGAAKLSSYLEAVHGIRPTAALAVPDGRPDVVVEPVRAEPTEFDVMLDGFDPARRVAVIKVVRETTSLGLKEARDLVEGSPAVVKELLPRDEAERLKARLEEAGARVSLRSCAA